jgi:hypothetical protein
VPLKVAPVEPGLREPPAPTASGRSSFSTRRRSYSPVPVGVVRVVSVVREVLVVTWDT